MIYGVLLLALTAQSFGLKVCDRLNSVDISDGDMSNDSLTVVKAGIKYASNEYFYDEESGSLRGCECKRQTCIRKCCPIGLGYDPRKKTCVPVTEEFDPPVWNKYRRLEGVRAVDRFRFITQKHNCTDPEVRVRTGQVTQNYHIVQDGSLYVEMPNVIPPWTVRGPDKYCIDTFVFEDEYGGRTTRLDALVCFAENQEDHHYVLSSTCMLISCVFILATCAVYAWLPELRNLHGRVLMAYLSCLFVGFSFLTAMQILLVVDNITPLTCVIMTIIIYFSLLVAFFWLNVMSFDIWWTFSGKRGLSLEKLSTRGRFYAYALYAFSIPTALTILMTALEFSGLPPHPLLPMLRHQGCFLFGTSKLIYLYGPITILCAANMIFFVLTALKITQIKQQTSVLKSKESSTHDQHRNDRQRLLLYVKLFAVMGINWILEVISAIYPQANNVWRITDAYNVLIGVIIFIIFVCKRKIFHLIKKRYKQLRGDPMSRNQTTVSSRTSSRDESRLNSIRMHEK
ncbi:G-protein coupled receptor Mth2-like isoform X1 [Ostrinia nubilalis]|uniref:G-protein coupled receptor Mth2-like isoform X1 n=1 Tax=Ostrinia nubilalis TaxID=29057 RepID=UPI0030825237